MFIKWLTWHLLCHVTFFLPFHWNVCVFSLKMHYFESWLISYCIPIGIRRHLCQWTWKISLFRNKFNALSPWKNISYDDETCFKLTNFKFMRDCKTIVYRMFLAALPHSVVVVVYYCNCTKCIFTLLFLSFFALSDFLIMCMCSYGNINADIW